MRVVATSAVELKQGQPVRVEGIFRVKSTDDDGFVTGVFRVEKAWATRIE